MGTFLEICLRLFESADLYEIIGVEKNAKDKQLKKGYYQQSLKFHPDRVPANKKAEYTEKFQALCKIYSVLSDKELRAVYDETGEVEDEDVSQDREWVDYWRLLFPKVTKEDIVKFEDKYRGSAEEREDVKKAYLNTEGDIDKILSSVMCSTIEDEDRFSEMISEMIRQEEVPAFSSFTKETKPKKQARKRKAKNEAREAEKAARELAINGSGGTDSLQALIRGRQQTRQREMDGFLDRLAAKYTSEDEPRDISPKKGRTTNKAKGVRKKK